MIPSPVAARAQQNSSSRQILCQYHHNYNPIITRPHILTCIIDLFPTFTTPDSFHHVYTEYRDKFIIMEHASQAILTFRVSSILSKHGLHRMYIQGHWYFVYEANLLTHGALPSPIQHYVHAVHYLRFRHCRSGLAAPFDAKPITLQSSLVQSSLVQSSLVQSSLLVRY